MDQKQTVLNHDTTPQVTGPTGPSMDPKSDEFRKFVEVEVLKIIKELAEKGDTTQERIQDIARETLEKIKPGMTLDKLYENAIKLDDVYPELAPIVTKIMGEYEQKFEKKAIDQVSQMVKAGNYDGAQDMIKKVLMFKVAS